jgi:hypothetical protein
MTNRQTLLSSLAREPCEVDSSIIDELSREPNNTRTLQFLFRMRRNKLAFYEKTILFRLTRMENRATDAS